MKFSLPYGSLRKDLSLEDKYVTSIVSPPRLPNVDEVERLSSAIEHPIGSPGLKSFLSGARDVTIVVPDKTRRGRVNIVLPFLIERLVESGVEEEAITIIFANGAHAKQSEEEKRNILGDEIYFSFRIEEHDAYHGNFVDVGATHFGTEVRLNAVVAHAHRVIAIGPIVHHYFAGFGGGPKLLMPGVAAYQSILQNHRRTLTPEGNFQPNCEVGALDGNPVAEDIADAVRFFPPTFFLGTIHDASGKIVDAVAGDILQAHRLGAKKVEQMNAAHLDEPADLVIASAGGYPKDLNFIQAHKAIHHAAKAVRDGGVLLIFAECREGIGSQSFLQWFNMPIDEMKRHLFNEYTLHGHTALSLRTKAQRITIVLVSSLPDEVVESMGLVAARTPEKGLEEARSRLTNSFKAIILTDGSITVPRIKGA